MAFSAKKHIEKLKRNRLSLKVSNLIKKSISYELRIKDDAVRMEALLISRYKLKMHPTRFKNRCIVTNRSKSVIRSFGLSRITLRSRVLSGYLPAVSKASW